MECVHAPNTVLSYRTGMRSFQKWADRYHIQKWWPPRERHLCLWLTHLVTYSQPRTSSPLKYSTVRSYLAAINSRMLEEGSAGVRHMKVLQRFMKAVKRRVGTRAAKKRPITLEDISLFPSNSQSDIVMRGIALVGFFGLMRINEVLSPDTTVENITFVGGDVARLYLPISKTDPFRGGVGIYIPSNPNGLCAVSFLKKIVEYRGSGRIFVDEDGVPITRKKFVTWLKDNVRGDPSEYSGHSLRRGGAMALSKAGCPIHLIKQWGRWKSDAVTEYLQIDLSTFREYGTKFHQLGSSKDSLQWATSHIWGD